MKGPGSENELAKKAKKMKFPSQYDSSANYGGSKSVSLQKVQMCSSGPDHKCYGSRAIAVKGESTLLKDLAQLHENDDELSSLPDLAVSDIKSNIRKGAKDLEQNWKDALELTKRAYLVSGINLPTPTQSKAWKQYEDLIKYGVQQMAATRGLDGDWRLTAPALKEFAGDEKQYKHVGSKRFFVELPGYETMAVEADSIDDIIEKVTNKIKASRDVLKTKVVVDHKTKHGAILLVFVDGIKRERVLIKQHG